MGHCDNELPYGGFCRVVFRYLNRIVGCWKSPWENNDVGLLLFFHKLYIVCRIFQISFASTTYPPFSVSSLFCCIVLPLNPPCFMREWYKYTTFGFWRLKSVRWSWLNLIIDLVACIIKSKRLQTGSREACIKRWLPVLPIYRIFSQLSITEFVSCPVSYKSEVSL